MFIIAVIIIYEWIEFFSQKNFSPFLWATVNENVMMHFKGKLKFALFINTIPPTYELNEPLGKRGTRMKYPG